MKRLISLSLLICTLILSLSGCGLLNFNRPILSIFDSNKRIGMRAKVESDKLIFDKDAVTLDFFYAFYSLNVTSLENKRRAETPNPPDRPYQGNYGIYLSHNKHLIFEEDENGRLIDYETNVNAQLLKFIPFDEAFGNNYGYTTEIGVIFNKINYGHYEKLTIPSELFNCSNEYVYIHIIEIKYNFLDGAFYKSRSAKLTLTIPYKLISNNKVRLYND